YHASLPSNLPEMHYSNSFLPIGGVCHEKSKGHSQPLNHRKSDSYAAAQRDLREREYLTPKEVDRLQDAARKHSRYGHRHATAILIAYRQENQPIGDDTPEPCPTRPHKAESCGETTVCISLRVPRSPICSEQGPGACSDHISAHASGNLAG